MVIRAMLRPPILACDPPRTCRQTDALGGSSSVQRGTSDALHRMKKGEVMCGKRH
jgi:hypothetical protein